jgi:hypothetical protein
MISKSVLINAQRMELISYYLKNRGSAPLSKSTLDFLAKEAEIGAKELALALHPLRSEK